MDKINGNKKLLIIEAHKTLSRSLSSWLLELFPAIEIYQGVTGEEGLSIANSINPDIALVDIALPGINGFEVTRFMKKNRLKTKVILLTSIEGQNYQVESITAGAYAYINKKDMYKMLPSTIQSIIN
ncbi:MAG: response regulator [Bacteroidetes bacterium]|nr:response regulator [Bacteroidota bacterium]MBL6943025.1 response regulator [Bacteroidales bacterium]